MLNLLEFSQKRKPDNADGPKAHQTSPQKITRGKRAWRSMGSFGSFGSFGALGSLGALGGLGSLGNLFLRAREMIVELHRSWALKAGVEGADMADAVEVSPLTSYAGEDLTAKDFTWDPKRPIITA